MTQQLRQKTILPSFRPIAPSLTPTNTSWTVNNLENRKRENPATDDSPAKHFQNSDGGYTTNLTVNTSSDAANETLTADQRARRKEQNRAAQRAFRQRKEEFVKELETKIKMMEKSHAQALAAVEQENQLLREKVKRLEQALGRQPGTDGEPDHDKAVDMATSALKGTTISSTGCGKSQIITNDHTYYQQDQPMNDNSNTKENNDIAMILYSSSPSSSTFSPTPTRKTAPSSAVACIRDKDGVSFCERLKEEVCSSAYNQLLSEPLFDASGSLNETVTNHPVPIVTDRMDEDDENKITHSIDEEDEHRFDMYDDPIYFLDRLTETLATERFDLSSPHPDTLTPDVKLIPCSRVWQTLSAHPKFDAFDVDMLCDELKKIAKCSGTGPVFTEHELNALVHWMEKQTDQVSPLV